MARTLRSTTSKALAAAAEILRSNLPAAQAAAEDLASPSGLSLSEVVHEFVAFRAALKDLDDAITAYHKIQSSLEFGAVPDALMDADVRTMTLAGVRVGTTTTRSCRMLDKDAAMEWLRANGHGGVIGETVHASTLAALVTELADEGVDIPADIFEYTARLRASVTRVSGGRPCG